MKSHKNNHNHKLSKFCAIETQQKLIENRFDLNKITLFQKIKLIYRNYPIKIGYSISIKCNNHHTNTTLVLTQFFHWNFPNIFFPRSSQK